jgi:GTPase
MDLVTEAELLKTESEIRHQVKSQHDEKVVVVMRPDRDHTLIARNLDSSIPLFRVSNTSGQGIELLTDFLCALPLDIRRW